MIEDYFSAIDEYLYISPVAFVSMPLLPSMLQCALKSLECTGAASLIAIYSWITDLFETIVKGKIPQSNAAPILQILVDPAQGGALMQTSFRGLLTTFPRERELVDYLGACFKAYGTLAQEALFGFVNGIVEGYTEEEMPRTVKDAFKIKFSKYVCLKVIYSLHRALGESDSQRLSSVLQDFSASFKRRNFKLSRQGA